MTEASALHRYGRHLGSCIHGRWVWVGGKAGGRVFERECDCGFKEVAERAGIDWKLVGDSWSLVNARP